MIEPTKLKTAFARIGDKNTIPLETSLEGAASFDAGFPPETEIPLEAGGIPPARKDFNGILNALSAGLVWMQSGGLWTYDAEREYEHGAIVEHNYVLYYCLKPNGGRADAVCPGTNTEYWVEIVSAEGKLNVDAIRIATAELYGVVKQSETPAGGVVPLADSNGKLTKWLNALKNDATKKVDVSISGNADTATRWVAAQQFSIKDSVGSHTGASVSINGTSPATIPLPSTITATLDGHAISSTKSSQDRLGQQIDSTYIKKLTASGDDVLYTLGNGATGVAFKMESVKGVACGFGQEWTVPAGGKWVVFLLSSNYNSTTNPSSGWICPGGTTLNAGVNQTRSQWIAWRIA